VGQIKESIKNKLKIKETGSFEIKLGTYDVILAYLLELQYLSMQLTPSLLLLMQWPEFVRSTALSSFKSIE
jgi:hypothetical protein